MVALMVSYAKQQNMDFKWQVARKLDRIDLGAFAALEFFYRNEIIFGLVRAMDPEEAAPKDDKVRGVEIPDLITSLDDRITRLQSFDTTALLMGKTNLPEVQKFQVQTFNVWTELSEVIYRCKLTDSVRVTGEEL